MRGNKVTVKQKRTFLERVAAGDTISQAAEAAGASPSPFYSRADRNSLIYDEAFALSFAEAIQERFRTKADDVDARFDEWINDPDCPPALRLAWGKRWNPAYRDQQRVEISSPTGGPVEVKVEYDYDRLLDKLEQVGVLRRGEAPAVDAEVVDGTEPRELLSTRSD